MARARLSMALAEVSGRMEGGVAVRSRRGTVLRALPTFKQAKHPATVAAQERMRAASAVWNTLSAAQAEEWARYAKSLSVTHAVTGITYSPPPKNAFVGLATRYLQANPEGVVPLAPPTDSFEEDDVLLEASGEDGLTFVASGPNRPGVVTELMAQPLKNERCAPGKRFKSQRFVAFAPGSLQVALGLPPGWYAAAYRFMDAATGQAAEPWPLGKVQVG